MNTDNTTLEVLLGQAGWGARDAAGRWLSDGHETEGRALAAGRAAEALLAKMTAGARVRFKHDVDRYPHFIVDAGELGTVVDHGDPSIFAVRLDELIEGAEDWENECHWSNGDNPLDDLELVEAPTDESLGRCEHGALAAYCTALHEANERLAGADYDTPEHAEALDAVSKATVAHATSRRDGRRLPMPLAIGEPVGPAFDDGDEAATDVAAHVEAERRATLGDVPVENVNAALAWRAGAPAHAIAEADEQDAAYERVSFPKVELDPADAAFIAENLDYLAGVDEGENTDRDRLLELARALEDRRAIARADALGVELAYSLAGEPLFDSAFVNLMLDEIEALPANERPAAVAAVNDGSDVRDRRAYEARS